MFYSNDNFQRQKILTFIAFYSTDLNKQTFPLYIVILTHEENNFKKTLWKKVKLLKISPLSTRFSLLCNLYFKILLQPHFRCLLFHSDMHFHTRFACCGTMAGLFIGPALLAVVLWQVFSLDPLCLLWYYGRSFHWTRFACCGTMAGLFIGPALNLKPFLKQALVFRCLQYKSFENAMGKGESAHKEQFLLFSQCFLPIWRTR